MEQANKLRSRIDTDLLRNIFVIALPVIGEMALTTLVGIFDTIMIGKGINSEALAAVGFANQIVFFLTFVFGSFNTGATAMIARYTGEENTKKVQQVFAQNLFLNIILGFIITIVIFVFGENLLMIFDTSEGVRKQALSYLKIVTVAQIAMFINFSLTASFRGVGETSVSMKINGIINITNIIGNYLLIFGPLFFPALGVEGAAISTASARIIGAVIFIYVSLKGYKNLHLDLELMKLTKEIFYKLAKLSSSAALEQVVMQTSFMIGVILVSTLSVANEAAFQVLLRIESLSYMPAIGLSIGASTLVGQALGANDIDKATKVGYTSVAMGVIYGALIGLLFFIFPKQLLLIFTDDPEVIQVSITTLKVAGFNQWLLASIIILGGALRGAGDTLGVMIITFVRLMVVQTPINYLFIIVLNLGIVGFWLAETITFLVFVIVYLHRFKSKKWTEIRI